jgi:hypothetical protein
METPDRPTTGIQYARPAREHGLDQPGLSAKIRPSAAIWAEPFDIPLVQPAPYAVTQRANSLTRSR